MEAFRGALALPDLCEQELSVVGVVCSNSPNSVHTEGVLAVILGLADWCVARTDVFCDQLLCAGCGDRPCCLAPV